MATNDFIGFASSGAANVMSQADYAAAAEQGNGVQPGMASSRLANKAWRQGANMAAAIGELIKNHGNDALDNGDLVTLYNALLAATASPTLAGLMSAADKTKVDSVILTNATQSAAGYMSAADKTRLDSVILTNATQSAAGYMSAEDKAALDNVPSTYFPLSGGNITNGTNKLSLLPGLVKISSESPFINFHHGNTTTDYTARIINSADGQLEILISTDSGDSPKALTLKSDGTLTWKELLINPVKYAFFADNRAIIEYENKFQIVASMGTVGTESGDVITFPRPFSAIPIVLCQHPGSILSHMQATAATTTGFTVAHSQNPAIAASYIAIGEGV